MKCAACGYEKNWDWDDEGERIEIGDEEFEPIEGVCFHLRKDDYYENDTKVRLFACPKCGTVRMERD